MSLPATITQAVAEKIIAFLAPLFLAGAAGNLEASNHAAIAMLKTYAPTTDRELRFAALSIAFGFGALDALSRAADPDLTLNQVLRLRGTANALNRSAHQNETRLEKLRKHPPEAQSEDSQPEPLPASTAAEDLLAFARLQSIPQAQTAPLSRQQRRAEERRQEKIRQRQQEQARLAARTAARLQQQASV
jgi:hypothetical protein